MRSALLKKKEQELIERAKRDEEIESIEDSQTKEKIKAEIVSMRNERDQLYHDSKKMSEGISNESENYLRREVSEKYSELAKTLKSMANIEDKKGNIDQAKNLLSEAMEYERRSLH